MATWRPPFLVCPFGGRIVRRIRRTLQCGMNFWRLRSRASFGGERAGVRFPAELLRERLRRREQIFS